MNTPVDSTRPARRVIMARVLRGVPDDGLFDLDFWAAIGDQGRFAAAWQMVVEADLMRGGDGREPRLQRSVCSLQRR
jgi:hypothetical protein